MTRWEVLDGLSLASMASTELGDAEQRYGAPIFTVHRADLHNELMRLATTSIPGQKEVSLEVAAKVKTAFPEAGIVQLENGTTLKADLIVGADGLHSVIKPTVLHGKSPASRSSGMSAFRFQIPTDMLKTNEHFQKLLKSKGRGSTVLADTKQLTSERHLVWYDCQRYGYCLSCTNSCASLTSWTSVD